MTPNKHWQNLIHRKCPCCDARLEHRKEPNANHPLKEIDFYVCEDKCGFIITRGSYVKILEDETHIMRRFLTKHERELLQLTLRSVELFEPDAVNPPRPSTFQKELEADYL